MISGIPEIYTSIGGLRKIFSLLEEDEKSLNVLKKTFIEPAAVRLSDSDDLVIKWWEEKFNQESVSDPFELLPDELGIEELSEELKVDAILRMFLTDYDRDISYEESIEGKSVYDFSPHAIFFLDESKEQCELYRKKFGQLFLSCQDTVAIRKFARTVRLVEEKKTSIFELKNNKGLSKRNVYQDWSLFSKVNYLCNTLIIVDDYIISKYDDGKTEPNDKDFYRIKENLRPVLDRLMPKNMDDSFVFNLMFVTDSSDLKLKLSESQQLEKILDEEIRMLRGYPINICVHYDLKWFGEKWTGNRRIITNYMCYTLDKGLDSIKNDKVLRQNRVCCFHYLDDTYTTTMENLVKSWNEKKLLQIEETPEYRKRIQEEAKTTRRKQNDIPLLKYYQKHLQDTI